MVLKLNFYFNITTWKDLSETTVNTCNQILKSGGDRYKMHNPGTWPKQAELAYKGQWQELLNWQETLKRGRKQGFPMS